MLVPQILIFQNNPSELIFRDTTPAYSPQYVGGYGGVNIDADQVTKVVLTLDLGRGYYYDITGAYKQGDADWTIAAYELPSKTTTVVPDCQGCGHSQEPSFNEGIMEEFPSGCITISYKVYSGADPDFVLEGVAITKFILRIKEQNRLIKAFHKLTIPNADGCYDSVIKSDKRKEVLSYAIASWTDIEMMDEASGADCNCIAGSLKLINSYLDQVLQ